MTIGLTTDKMKEIFENEYIATLKRRQKQQQAFAVELISQGMSEIDANKEAMYQIRQESTIQALILMIQANNNEIEKHL